jgi:hypothetical protein
MEQLNLSYVNYIKWERISTSCGKGTQRHGRENKHFIHNRFKLLFSLPLKIQGLVFIVHPRSSDRSFSKCCLSH